MLKKKSIYLLFAGQDCQHPYFSILVLVQSREWNLAPTTLQSSTLPLNHSSMGLTRIEPKFNSAAKAAWIGCMTLWMISRHFMKRSSCTKFNWFELFSRPWLDSTIHCINHHLVDKR